MHFEYDENKSRANLAKHAIDLVEAQLIWQDSKRLEVRLITERNETRYQIIARIDDLIWTAIFTYRAEAIRIISVRRARKKEVMLYENS